MSNAEARLNQAVKEILSGGLTRTVLSVILGFLVGALFMIGSNQEFLNSLGYFFSRPQDAFGAAWSVVSQGYGALFRGALVNLEATDFESALRPFTETIRFASPLIIAGLGLGVAFRAGLFNIGATGQIVAGMAGAVFVATKTALPAGIHQLTAIVVAVICAAAWGAMVGFLKARTGAHEVILTIMFNYVAIGLFAFLLRTPGLLKEDSEASNPKAGSPLETALFPRVLGESFSLHWGVLLAVISLVIYWWFMERSTLGFRVKAVGYNPAAAKTAGIEPNRITIVAMTISAAFMGFVASYQVLGNSNGATVSSHVNIGFDAITVALLGGSSTFGVLFAGLLFGAFKAGSPAMQIVGVSADVLTIVQAAIVLFIAAPPLVRALFFLPKNKGEPSKKIKVRKSKSSKEVSDVN